MLSIVTRIPMVAVSPTLAQTPFAAAVRTFATRRGGSGRAARGLYGGKVEFITSNAAVIVAIFLRSSASITSDR